VNIWLQTACAAVLILAGSALRDRNPQIPATSPQGNPEMAEALTPEVTVPLEFFVAAPDAQLWATPEAIQSVRPLRRGEKLEFLDAVSSWLRVHGRDGAVGYVSGQAVAPTKSNQKKWGTPVFWKYPRRRYLPSDQMSRTELTVSVIFELDGLYYDGVRVDPPLLMSKALYSYYQRDLLTASCYLALAVDLLLGSQRTGQVQASPKRVYELLEAAKFEVSPPLFRVQVDGQWHSFEIQGNKIHGVD
jgi:hypothetical protein